jgi:hypothetical protein
MVFFVSVHPTPERFELALNAVDGLGVTPLAVAAYAQLQRHRGGFLLKIS